MARQFLIPGSPFGGYINETASRQYLLPNVVYLSDTTSGATGAALVATITAVATVTSNITTSITLTSSATCLCVVIADLSTNAPAALVASLTGLVTVTSGLTTSVTLAASVTCICTIAASLALGVPLAASLTGLSTISVVADLFYVGSGGIVTNPIPFPPIPHVTEKIFDSHIWQNWLSRLNTKVTKVGQLNWNQLSFKDSNLTDLNTRRHNDLQQIQGGAAGDEYHLTLQQHDKVDVDEILLWLSF